MNKIPTIFERDWNGDRSRVTEQPADACAWVFNGEGWVIDMDGGSLWIPTGNVAAIYTETTT